jgi:integrase
MMTPTDPFKAHYLPVEAWPRLCQKQWHEAFADGGLFDTPKPALSWRKATIRKTWTGFGSFISWTILEDLFDPDAGVTNLVTRAHMTLYIKALQNAGYASLTLFCRIQEVYDAARIMDPSQDWAWLRTASRRLRKRARPIRNKHLKLQPAQALEQLAHDLMDEAQSSKQMSFYQRALRFRDGLMIGVLIRRPLRLKNFASLTLSTNLILHHQSATMTFQRDEMKGKRPFDVRFPSVYFEALQIYLALYRPYLLSLHPREDKVLTDALWISNEGQQLADLSLRNAIKRRTKVAFGIDMTPHLFRDASVTTLVRHAPASARLTRTILGHTSIDITNKHYNQSRMIETSRRHTALIEKLTTNATQKVS